jgi:hypothetical protein
MNTTRARCLVVPIYFEDFFARVPAAALRALNFNAARGTSTFFPV